MAPAGTPSDIVSRLNKVTNEALGDPSVRTRLEQSEPFPTPAAKPALQNPLRAKPAAKPRAQQQQRLGARRVLWQEGAKFIRSGRAGCQPSVIFRSAITGGQQFLQHVIVTLTSFGVARDRVEADAFRAA